MFKIRYQNVKFPFNQRHRDCTQQVGPGLVLTIPMDFTVMWPPYLEETGEHWAMWETSVLLSGQSTSSASGQGPLRPLWTPCSTQGMALTLGLSTFTWRQGSLGRSRRDNHRSRGCAEWLSSLSKNTRGQLLGVFHQLSWSAGCVLRLLTVPCPGHAFCFLSPQRGPVRQDAVFFPFCDHGGSMGARGVVRSSEELTASPCYSIICQWALGLLVKNLSLCWATTHLSGHRLQNEQWHFPPSFQGGISAAGCSPHWERGCVALSISRLEERP